MTFGGLYRENAIQKSQKWSIPYDGETNFFFRLRLFFWAKLEKIVYYRGGRWKIGFVFVWAFCRFRTFNLHFLATSFPLSAHFSIVGLICEVFFACSLVTYHLKVNVFFAFREPSRFFFYLQIQKVDRLAIPTSLISFSRMEILRAFSFTSCNWSA